MKKLHIKTYLPQAPASDDALIGYLKELQDKYPASSVVNFIYLKLLCEKNPKEYEKIKYSCFSVIINKRLFYEYQIDETPLPGKEENRYSPQKEELINEVIPVEDDTNSAVEIGQLVNQFSHNPPKMGFNPEVHNLNDNYGKQSLKEDPELISETLANIYAEQGYIGKAEKMFKKLSLHFPEKSVYFAAQIKKLKNIENQ